MDVYLGMKHTFPAAGCARSRSQPSTGDLARSSQLVLRGFRSSLGPADWKRKKGEAPGYFEVVSWVLRGFHGFLRIKMEDFTEISLVSTGFHPKNDGLEARLGNLELPHIG